MSCKEIKTAKYQTRKSPAFHANLCKHLTKKGKDGNYVSRADVNGLYKWFKVNKTRKQKGVRTYEIHYNGSMPFFVEVAGTSVRVLKNMNTFKIIRGVYIDIKKEPKELFKIHVEKVLLGKKPPYGDYTFETGNSILLKINEKKYRFIGSRIYDFNLVKGDTLLSFYSGIGNNDVPYPYAIGKTHVYIFLDKVAIEKSYFTMKKDIYEQNYYPHRIHMCKAGNPKTDLCKDKSVYGPKVKEYNDKKVSLDVKMIE